MERFINTILLIYKMRIKNYKKVAELEYEAITKQLVSLIKEYQTNEVRFVNAPNSQSLARYKVYIFKPSRMPPTPPTLDGFIFEGASNLKGLENLMDMPYLPRNLFPKEIRVINPPKKQDGIWGVFFKE